MNKFNFILKVIAIFALLSALSCKSSYHRCPAYGINVNKSYKSYKYYK